MRIPQKKEQLLDLNLDENLTLMSSLETVQILPQ